MVFNKIRVYASSCFCLGLNLPVRRYAQLRLFFFKGCPVFMVQAQLFHCVVQHPCIHAYDDQLQIISISSISISTIEKLAYVLSWMSSKRFSQRCLRHWLFLLFASRRFVISVANFRYILHFIPDFSGEFSLILYIALPYFNL